MSTKSINKIFRAGLAGCGFAVALAACTDTWDDHYEADATGVNAGTLWEAIQQHPDLSNFASVVEATGYGRSLGSSQVFTVFAPTNATFSKQEADDLIAQYLKEKNVENINDDDNTVIKEFVQNHIALFNYSVSPQSNDSIVLMNGKYALLTADQIDNSHFSNGMKNQLYGNGVLFALDQVMDYSANIFEQMRKDSDLDSVRSFLYNPLIYKKVFQPASSVEGGIDELGRMTYLDSVFYQRNDLFTSLNAKLNDEDSTYWMVVPDNAEWDRLTQEYSQYFNYEDSVYVERGNRDSLVYTNTRLAILQGAAFSRTFNKDILSGMKTATSETDSVVSTSSYTSSTRRATAWGMDFGYYQFTDPLNAATGILGEANYKDCSNGRLMKVSDWKIAKEQTFHRYLLVEGESSRGIKEIERGNDGKKDIDLATSAIKNVDNNDYIGKLWNDRYMQFTPALQNKVYSVTYNLTNVLSNIGYDIYLVMAPALANDSNAAAVELRPTKFRCTLSYHDQRGKTQEVKYLKSTESTSQGVFTTSGVDIDYILLSEDFKFDVATRGINEDEPSVTLKIENRVSNSEASNGSFTKTMNIDCILLVPHGTLEVTDNLGAAIPELEGQKGVLMYPFGKDNGKVYHKLR